MICQNCGAEVQEGAKFCKHCGTPQNPASSEPVKTEESANAKEQVPQPEKNNEAQKPVNNQPIKNPDANKGSGKAEKPKKSVAKIIIPIVIAIVAVAAIVGAVAVVLVMMPKKVNLNEYLSVEFEGYDTMGTAKIKYDEELLEVLGKELGLSNRDISKLESVEAFLAGNEEDYSRDARKLYACMKTLDIKLDQDKDLNNGDTVTLKVKYDNDEAKEYKIKFLGEDETYTVKDLEKLDIIDAFADYTLTFSGIAPDGTARGEYNGPTTLADGYTYIDYYYFSIDNAYSLRNGDTVTVKININEDALLGHGAKLKEISKSYTVEGLDEYVTSYDGFTAEYLDYAKTEANDVVSAYVAQNNNAFNLDSLEYAGYIFDSPKPDANYWGNHNDLYIIYKGVISYEGNNDEVTSVTVYFPVQYYNILSTADGLDGKKNDTIMGYSVLPSSRNSVRGYVSPILAYTDMVGSKVDTYQVESGDGFETFAEYTTIAALDEISSEGMQDLESKAVDTVNQYIAKDYGNDYNASDLSVCGYYLLTAKEQTGDLRSNNRIFVVCQATVSHSKKRFATTTVYYPVEFDGLVNLPNGEFLFVENKGIQGSCYFENSYYYTKGYVEGTKMFDDLVTQKRVNYSYEVSEGLKEFGE